MIAFWYWPTPNGLHHAGAHRFPFRLPRCPYAGGDHTEEARETLFGQTAKSRGGAT